MRGKSTFLLVVTVGPSLVAYWLRIHPIVQEIPGWVTKTLCTTEPVHSGAHVPQLECPCILTQAATTTRCSQINKYFKKLSPVEHILYARYTACVPLLTPLLFSCSVVSDSFATPWTIPARFPCHGMLECAAISFSS